MSGLVTIAGAVVGLAVGPFLRRLVDQVPDRLPLFEPPGGQLVPVASWFAVSPAGTRVLVGSPDERDERTVEVALRQWRAPVIDLGAAAVLAILAHRIGWNASLPAFLIFGAVLVAVTVIDLDHFRIPDRIVFPCLGATVILLGLAALVHDVSGAFIAAIAGSFAYFGFLFVFFFIWPRGMGFGDVKLAAVLGLHLGWAGAVSATNGGLEYRGLEWGLQLVLMGALVGSVLGAAIGLGVLVVMRRRGAFPFGPALCLGALLAIVFSAQLVN